LAIGNTNNAAVSKTFYKKAQCAVHWCSLVFLIDAAGLVTETLCV